MMQPRDLRPSAEMPRVYLYPDAMDFRKQSHGLAAIVELAFGHKPLHYESVF